MNKYDFDLNSEENPEDVLEKIKKYGVVRIFNYCKNTSKIKKELLKIFDSIEQNYEYGKQFELEKHGMKIKHRLQETFLDSQHGCMK